MHQSRQFTDTRMSSHEVAVVWILGREIETAIEVPDGMSDATIADTLQQAVLANHGRAHCFHASAKLSLKPSIVMLHL